MAKNESDLDEELNENLDFLEDDEAHINPSGNTAVPYNKGSHQSSNLPKQLLMISVLGAVGIIVIWSMMHTKKTHHVINLSPIQTTTAANASQIDNKQHHNQTHQHTSTQAEHTLPTKHEIEHNTQTTNQEATINAHLEHNNQLNNNQQQNIETLPNATSTANQHSSMVQDPQLAQIGQIKPSQATPQKTQQPTNGNNIADQKANNNLTWQELKKSIPPENNSLPNTSGQQAISSNNTESSVPVMGFQKIITNNQTLPTAQQLNYNYKIQENMQELKTIVANITEELTANVNQIKELQNNLKDISRSISNVSNSVSGVDSKILNLTNTVDNLSMDVKNVKKYMQEEDLDLTANLKPSEPDLFSSSPEYVVHAVIPGRAWLKSSSGQIITVTEGDSLGDYGKIALIDAANNIVRTSSGVVFR